MKNINTAIINEKQAPTLNQDILKSGNAVSFSNIELVANKDWQSVELNGETVEIPVGWSSIRTQNHIELLQNQKSHQIPSAKVMREGALPIISQEASFINGYTDEKGKVVSVVDGAFLVFGDHTTILKYVDFNFVLGGDGTKVFKAKSGSTKFLYFALKGSVSSIGYSRHFKLLKDVYLGLPSLSEQTLIANLLSSQEDHLANLKQIASLERKKLAFLSDELLSGRLLVEDDLNGDEVVVTRDDKGNALETLPAVKLVANKDWQSVELNGETVEIPMGWDFQPLSCLAKVSKGKQVDFDFLKERSGIANYPYINGGRSASGYSKKSNSKEQTIAISEGGASAGFVQFVETKWWCGGHCYSVDGFKMENRALYWILKHNEESIMSMKEGTGLPNLKSGDVMNVGIKAPPLPQQILIAKLLSSQEDRLVSIEKEISAEEKKFAWLSDELLSGRLLIKEKENV